MYNAASKKYYKPYKENKDWEGAQLQCSSDGATLIESRTHAEHEALRWMYGELGFGSGGKVTFCSEQSPEFKFRFVFFPLKIKIL